MALQKLSTDPQRVLLKGAGLSGRGIQFRMLNPEEKRNVDLDAAKTGGKDANQVLIHEVRTRDGMARMLMEVTDEAGLESFDDPRGLTWHKLTLAELNNPTSDYYLQNKELFTTRDLEFIEAIYNTLHNVPQTEFDAIMGKALKVASA